jgi:L-iditol 2-dehydrogenase
MWAQRLVAPFMFGKEEVSPPCADDLAPGQVLTRTLTTGICGSDLPYFKGLLSPFATLEGGRHVSPPGFPVHELVGEVVASRDERLAIGARVVGWASDNNALTELVVADGGGLYEYDPRRSSSAAIMLQPLACVIYALEQVPDIEGSNAAVIGQGPIGVLFSHVLKTMGARSVTGVDRVDRSDVAAVFGVDEMVHAASDQWAAVVKSATEAPSLIVEAVGHQVGTLRDAVDALAMNGLVYCFGIPDDEIYPFPMRLFLRKNARLAAGVTLRPWRRDALAKAEKHLEAHPELVEVYVTNVFAVDDVNQAFQLASRPAPGQLKVAMTTG